MTTTPESDQTGSSSGPRVNKLMFLGLFLPAVVLVVVAGYMLAKARFEARIEGILEYDSTQLQIISGFLGSEIMASFKHLRSLATEDATFAALQAPAAARLTTLESSFLTLAQRNPLYQQIRWIDENGMERARITRQGDELLVTERQDLQDRSEEYYFKRCEVMLPGELYMSRIDLSAWQSRKGMPPGPILRIATPVAGDDQRRRGIVIINIDMKYLFEYIRTRRQTDLEVDYRLVNQDGALLSAGFGNLEDEDASAPETDLSGAYPDVWARMSGDDAGSMETAEGLWTWQKLSPVSTFKQLNRVYPQYLVAFDQMISDDFALILLAHRPVATLEDVRREYLELITLGAVFILSVYAMTLAFYLSGTARARRAEVAAAHAKELAVNMERMKELEQRFHRLVEATSIGLLVVNSEGRIEISNAAADSILGYQRGGLEGLPVESLLPDGLRDKHADLREHFFQDPAARRMGTGRNLQAVRKDGTTIGVEVGLNPYIDDGRPLVLASIIELSESDE